MIRIDHIGIAVRDLKEACKLYERLLGKASYKTEELPREQVKTAFFAMGESKVELLESMGQESPISRFIEKRGEGVHHIAFEVKDIRREIARLKLEGFQFIAEEPREGADNKLICFLHPRSAMGTLIELCQEKTPQE